MTVIALSGGIGGAKLALGLAHLRPARDLMVIANTGDDFEHLGLAISPDTDTLMYTLAGLANQQLGWGRQDESWAFMETLAQLGGQTWFRLGDRDLAVHVERTRRLAAGETLSAITTDFSRRLGIACAILPMSDDRVRTELLTDQGWLEFQEYFVHQRCQPVVQALRFAGGANARPNPALLAALADPATEAVIICPSNPFISVEPILTLPGLRQAFIASAAPVIAVSPIVGGRAIKGPTAKMMAELGLDVSPLTVARRYRDVLDGFVLDHADAALAGAFDLPVCVTQTLMHDLAARIDLADACLHFATGLRQGRA